MDAKTPKAKRTKPASRYKPEELTPRDPTEDDAAIDAYLKRNRAALNASIRKAKAEFERGEYLTLEQVMAEITAQRQRRLRKQ